MLLPVVVVICSFSCCVVCQWCFTCVCVFGFSTLDEHQADTFQSWAVWEAATNRLARVSRTHGCILHVTFLGSELLGVGYMFCCYSGHQQTANSVSKWCVSLHHPQQVWGFRVSRPHQRLVVFCFPFHHSCGLGVVFHCDSDLRFPDDWWSRVCLYVYRPLVDCSFEVFLFR